MTFAIRNKTRSFRVTVTPADGEPVVISNMQGDEGFAVEFRVTRTMDDKLGSLEVTFRNLPPDLLGPIEGAQVRRVDDIDAALAGVQLFEDGPDQDGADAGPSGFASIDVEAGYDGNLTRVGRAVGCRILSDREDDDCTNVTTIHALENLDGLLLGVPSQTFPAGAGTHEAFDYLRRCLALGPGNATVDLWTAILGVSQFQSPFHATSGDALELLRHLTQFLAVRWWVDDRQIWICGREGWANFGQVAPYLPGAPKQLPPLLRRPRRVDGGEVECVTFLAPDVAPGELVVLSDATLTFPGVTPSQQEILRADVPPGVYRVQVISHAGSSSDDGEDSFTSTIRLRGMKGI